ncbi:MAG: hypothetical protein HQL63_07030 [Magnetococcales bacterium]|nr:hypothetical protein [Magnetococcales bacterium]MBF0321944.1 hypothetical protein [Magnetococcales bacterium]
MRIVTIIGLALLALVAMILGGRLLWRAFVPQKEGIQPHSGKWSLEQQGKWLLALLLLMLLALGIERIVQTPNTPQGKYEPPHMENGQIVPGRFH